MAKNKAKTELPTVDEMEVGGAYQVSGDVTPPAVVAIAAAAVTSRTVSVPLAQIPFGYLPRRIDLRKLTGRQSQALRQLQEALDSQGAKLANGSKIGNPANAIKWLLETMAG